MKRNVLSGVFVITGLATMAFGAWGTPFSGMTHQTQSTCRNEPCSRACRVCCVQFNSQTEDLLACHAASQCSSLPFHCPIFGDPQEAQLGHRRFRTGLCGHRFHG